MEDEVELGAENYDMYSLLNGKPSASLAIFQLPGANALNVAQQIRQRLREQGFEGGRTLELSPYHGDAPGRLVRGAAVRPSTSRSPSTSM